MLSRALLIVTVLASRAAADPCEQSAPYLETSVFAGATPQHSLVIVRDAFGMVFRHCRSDNTDDLEARVAFTLRFGGHEVVSSGLGIELELDYSVSTHDRLGLRLGAESVRYGDGPMFMIGARYRREPFFVGLDAFHNAAKYNLVVNQPGGTGLLLGVGVEGGRNVIIAQLMTLAVFALVDGFQHWPPSTLSRRAP
jgi:hypothetical protein